MLLSTALLALPLADYLIAREISSLAKGQGRLEILEADPVGLGRLGVSFCNRTLPLGGD